MDEDREIAFFSGFRWAVPEAFAAAVASFRFEQGDVLFRERVGYARLAREIPSGLTAIQVRLPPRSSRALPAESEGDRKLANWQSELELDRIELASGVVTSWTTTQGRLFTALWRGDEQLLDGSGQDPEMPRGARELAQALREGVLALPWSGRVSGTRFAFVVDRASDASRTKAAAISKALAPFGPSHVDDLAPADVNAPQAELFHPTLVVRQVLIGRVEEEAVEAALRRALYGGGADGERFSLARHGLLEQGAESTVR